MRKIIILTFLLLTIGVHAQTPTSGSFYPIPGGKYVVSGWVKEASSVPLKTYASSIKIQFLQGSVLSGLPILLLPSGDIIDGWQRITGIITIPVSYTDPSISIELSCAATGGADCFFDDIRFFPYNGNLKSFVYDEETQRLMAELDENNYATFYEYDLEGGLVRVKKETERGVFTIQETRSGNYLKASN
jgi:hypothetical protein